jgi:hypothetical protein
MEDIGIVKYKETEHPHAAGLMLGP